MVYFAQFETGEIKIGYSYDPVYRLAQLKREFDGLISLLKMIPGDRSDESNIHRRFCHLRICGEQFKPEPELMEFIAACESAERPERWWDCVKLDAGLQRMAKHVAIDRGITLAEYLSERLRPYVTQDFERLAKKFHRGGKAPQEGGE
jgi:hypothetical protein